MDVTPQLIVDECPNLVGPRATAAFSAPDRTHRYLLTRWWGATTPAVFIMLNPSSADAFTVDPTIRRCINYAQRWGCGGLIVANVFGLRSTDPAAIKTHPDPVGRHNDAVIEQELSCRDVGPVVAAWGMHATYMERGCRVAELLANMGVELRCLALTKGGHPAHPLYQRADIKLQPFGIGGGLDHGRVED